MTWIDALKYGLTALAALFGFWAVAKIKAQAGALSEAQARVIKSLMIFSIGLLLLSGLFALYEGFFLQGKRLREMRPILSRLDQTIGDRLSIDNDAFASLDAHSKQIVDNMRAGGRQRNSADRKREGRMKINANGISINSQIDGPSNASWLIFSNSLATNLSAWDDQAREFRSKFRVLRYDQRGHGGRYAAHSSGPEPVHLHHPA